MIRPSNDRPPRAPSDAAYTVNNRFPRTLEILSKPQHKTAQYQLAHFVDSPLSASLRTRCVELQFTLVRTKGEVKDLLHTKDHPGHFVCQLSGADLMKAMYSASWSLPNTPTTAFHFAFVSVIQLKDVSIRGLSTTAGPCSVQLLLQDCGFDDKAGRLIPARRAFNPNLHDPELLWKPYLEENKVCAYQPVGDSEAHVIPYAIRVHPTPHNSFGAAAGNGGGAPLPLYHMPAATTSMTLQYLDALAVGLDSFTVNTASGTCVRAPSVDNVCPDVLSYLLCTTATQQNRTAVHERVKFTQKVAKHAFVRWHEANKHSLQFDPRKLAVEKDPEAKMATKLAPHEEETPQLMTVTARELEEVRMRMRDEVLNRTRGVWDCTAGVQAVFVPFNVQQWRNAVEQQKSKDDNVVEFSATFEILYTPLMQWLGDPVAV